MSDYRPDDFADLDLEDSIDTTGQTPDTLDTAGLPAGKYHLRLMEVQKNSEKDRFDLSFLVLASDQPNVVGRVHREGLSNSVKDWPQRRKALFAIALGVLKKEDVGRAVGISWKNAPGHEVMATVKVETWKSPDGRDVTMSKIDAIMAPNDSRAEAFPRAGAVDMEI